MVVQELTTKTKQPSEGDLFKPIEEVAKRAGLKCLIWGSYGVGKTYTALSFPAPVRVISTEFGVAQLRNHFPGKDIRILECTEPYTDAPVKAKTGQTDVQPFAIDPVKSLEKVQQATDALKDVKGGTIVLDSGSDLWAWIGALLDYNATVYTGGGQMMRTEWSKANSKYRWILMRLLSRPCNFVLTSRASNVYDAKGQMTAMERAKVQQETPYFADLVLHLQKKQVANIGTDGKVSGTKNARVATIEKCRFADVGNLTIEDPTYEKLKLQLQSKLPEDVFQ